MRLTREKDEFPCRIGDRCLAESWIENITGLSIYDWPSDTNNVCEKCPFEKYINKLAEYEDGNVTFISKEYPI